MRHVTLRQLRLLLAQNLTWPIYQLMFAAEGRVDVFQVVPSGSQLARWMEVSALGIG
jgi:hypothetical protein